MAIDATLAVGIIGTFALILAWLWETYEDIKEGKVNLHLHFSALYIFGNLLLTAYAWWINSMVFVVLGIFLFVAIVCETIYAIKVGKGKGNKWLTKLTR